MTRRSPPRLSRRFFARDTQVVARALLGQILVHGERAGRIVETEAYLGPEDAASHARFGAKGRSRPMFGVAGLAYVYLCYGVHQLFNIVTEAPGVAGAVLIRGLEPVGPTPIDEPTAAALLRGPGKLTRALGIGRHHNEIDLTSSDTLYLVRGGRRLSPSEIGVGPRIGVSYAKEWAAAPLRFFVIGSAGVSGTRNPRG